MKREHHGKTHIPEYAVWCHMRQRCLNKNDAAYHNYGGRGISICESWSKFSNFFSDMGRRPSDQHSIDRKDNDGGYCPDNCRWATRLEQSQNRRKFRISGSRGSRGVVINGETKSITQWCVFYGVPRTSVLRRVHQFGWDYHRALTQRAD